MVLTLLQGGSLSLLWVASLLCLGVLGSELRTFHALYYKNRPNTNSSSASSGNVSNIPQSPNCFSLLMFGQYTAYGYRLMHLTLGFLAVAARLVCATLEITYYPKAVTYLRIFPELVFASFFSVLTVHFHQLSSIFHKRSFSRTNTAIFVVNVLLYILLIWSLRVDIIKPYITLFVVLKFLLLFYLLYSGSLVAYKITGSPAEIAKIRSRLWLLIGISTISLFLSCGLDLYHFSEHLLLRLYARAPLGLPWTVAMDCLMYTFVEVLPILAMVKYGLTSERPSSRNNVILLFEPMDRVSLRNSQSQLQMNDATSNVRGSSLIGGRGASSSLTGVSSGVGVGSAMGGGVSSSGVEDHGLSMLASLSSKFQQYTTPSSAKTSLYQNQNNSISQILRQESDSSTRSLLESKADYGSMELI